MDIVIREANEDDWDWIFIGMVESAFLTLHPRRRADIDRAALEKRVKADIDKYHTHAERPEQAYIAELNGQRAGLIWIGVTPWNDEPVKTTWLLDIFVVREHRGKGIAKLMMAKAEEWSRQHGGKEMWLNAGWFNEDALGLYRRLGFDIETVHMSKSL